MVRVLRERRTFPLVLLSLRIRKWVFHSNTRILDELLSPCFKTGGEKTFCQYLVWNCRMPKQPSRAMASRIWRSIYYTRPHTAREWAPRLRHPNREILRNSRLIPYASLAWEHATLYGSKTPPLQPIRAKPWNHIDHQSVHSARCTTKLFGRPGKPKSTPKNAPNQRPYNAEMNTWITVSSPFPFNGFKSFWLCFRSAFHLSFTVLVRYRSLGYI